jgi:hypothetical protein
VDRTQVLIDRLERARELLEAAMLEGERERSWRETMSAYERAVAERKTSKRRASAAPASG